MINKHFKYYLQFIFRFFKNMTYKTNRMIKYRNVLLLYKYSKYNKVVFNEIRYSRCLINSFKYNHIQFKLYNVLIRYKL